MQDHADAGADADEVLLHEGGLTVRQQPVAFAALDPACESVEPAQEIGVLMRPLRRHCGLTRWPWRDLCRERRSDCEDEYGETRHGRRSTVHR
ncbi:MAG: hypothetical protein ACK4ZY_11250 [Sphingomonas sp.]